MEEATETNEPTVSDAVLDTSANAIVEDDAGVFTSAKPENNRSTDEDSSNNDC